jgi:hypothetical protein
VTILVMDGDLLEEVLRRAGSDELVVAVASSAERLEELERVADPRVLYLIGDPDVLPLPDRFVDQVIGAADDGEVRRVCRR